MTLKECLVTIVLAGINITVFMATVAGADPAPLLLRPSAPAFQWLSYMFCHTEAIHFAVNLAVTVLAGLWLERTAGHAVTLAAYLSGGLSGALLFTVTCRVLDVNDTTLTGASAAALALVTVALVSRHGRARRRRLTPVVGAGIVLLGVIILGGLAGDNPGGAIAHIGGVAGGIAVAAFTAILGQPRRHRGACDTDLITKVRVSGYSSLSGDERSRLAADSDIISDGGES